jgi:SAM-dependent methyltransferase
LNRPIGAASEPRADYGSSRTPPTGRTPFEQQWHERFVEFASLRDDDAGIAGWSPSGLEARFRFFRRLWQPVAAGVRYVDVGCGAATYTRWLAAQGVYIVGIDYSHPALIKARSRAPADVPLCAGDATALPFANQSVDGVLCFGVLQAVSGSAAVVRELARVLKPGGELWIDALNRSALAARFERARLRLKGRNMHLRYESRPGVERILREAGFVDPVPHWLPIAPSRLRHLQPMLESRAVGYAMACVPGVGTLLSHAFVFHARRAA